MSIGSISSHRYASIDSVQNTSAVMPTSESGDGDGSVRGHRHSGGHSGAGGIGQAVMDALQSMGVSMPPPPGDSAGSPPSDDAGSDSQSQPAAGTADIRRDVKKLMGALFEALQGTASASGTGSAAATSSATGTGSASGSSFAASLSTLISQAANGSASTELQDAFTKLTTDLKAASGSSTSSSTNSGTSSNTDTTLQAFLSKLQDRLGYGAAGSSATTGNLISATA